MKLSCLPVSFFSEILEGRMSLVEWARMGVSLGFDAIDLSILFLKGYTPSELTKVRQEIEDEGIRITMITSYPDFTHPNRLQREKELVMEQEVIETATVMGAELVRVTAGQAHPETGREEGIEWAAEGLTTLIETTRDSGIKLVYENHSKPGAWQYTDFSQSPEIFLEIFRLTEQINLGINFDTGNAATFAEDPLALLKTVLPRVVSIHASDSAQKGTLRHVLIGTGITPFPEMFTCLQQTGWDGWICLEEASQLGRHGVEAAVEYIRKTWERTRSVHTP